MVNALFVVLLLLGGMLIPLAKLPGWLADLARVLPAAALADALHGALGAGSAVTARDWVVLAVWAVGAPVVAASPSAGSDRAPVTAAEEPGQRPTGQAVEPAAAARWR